MPSTENQFVRRDLEGSGQFIPVTNGPDAYESSAQRTHGPSIFNNDDRELAAAEANFSPAANGRHQAA